MVISKSLDCLLHSYLFGYVWYLLENYVIDITMLKYSILVQGGPGNEAIMLNYTATPKSSMRRLL